MKRFQVFGSVGCGRIRVNRRVSNCTFVKKVSLSVPHARGKIAWPSSTVRYFQFEGGGRANPRCWRPFRGVGCKLPGKLQRRLAVISPPPVAEIVRPLSLSIRTRPRIERVDSTKTFFSSLVLFAFQPGSTEISTLIPLTCRKLDFSLPPLFLSKLRQRGINIPLWRRDKIFNEKLGKFRKRCSSSTSRFVSIFEEKESLKRSKFPRRREKEKDLNLFATAAPKMYTAVFEKDRQSAVFTPRCSSLDIFAVFVERKTFFETGYL